MADRVLQAWSEGVGQAINDMVGLRFTRTTAQANEGDNALLVESTLDWPTSGSFFMEGTRYTYSGKAFNSLSGLRWGDQTQEAVATASFTAVAQTAQVPLSGYSVVHAVLSGTWVGTVVLEQYGPSGWTTVATYTANMDAEVIVTGGLARLRVSAYTSGTAVASLEVVARSGVKGQTRPATAVVDASRTYNALDSVRSQLLIDTAEGKYLDALARKLGVERPPNLTSDTLFREVVKALAYLPKGTMYGLELALTAFFGAGNFRVWEDFPSSRNTVFIQLLNGVSLSDDPEGATYLMVREPLLLDTGPREVTVTQTALGVQGVRLANEDRADILNTASKPSALVEVRYSGDVGVPVWTFSGTTETAVDMSVSATLGMRINNTPGLTTTYYRTARIRPESRASLRVTLRHGPIQNYGTAGNQITMHIRDGARDITVGFFGHPSLAATVSQVAFINPATGSALIGLVGTLPVDVFNTVEVRKDGDTAELWVNGAMLQSIDTALFPATVLNQYRYGCEDGTNTTDFYTKEIGFTAETLTDYWNSSGTGGAVNSGTPERLDTNSGVIVAGDVDHYIRTEGVNPVNTGLWRVKTVVDADNVDLEGDVRPGAFVQTAFPSRVTVANIADAFKYPQDVGKKLKLVGTGPNDGTFVIANLLDPVALTPLAGSLTATTNVVEVTAPPPFTTETGMTWQLIPNFTTEGSIFWELAGTGTLASPVITLRQNPPLNIPGGYEVIVEPTYSTVESGQVLESDDVDNSPPGSWYPFYLPQHPFGPFANYLEDLTVAGVIPEIVL